MKLVNKCKEISRKNLVFRFLLENVLENELSQKVEICVVYVVSLGFLYGINAFSSYLAFTSIDRRLT